MPYLLVFLTALIPITNFTSAGGGSGFFYALLAACLLRCFSREGGLGATLGALANYKALLIAFMLPLVAVLLSQLVLGVSHGTSIERGARFSLALPIMLGAFLSLDRQVLRQALWGLIAAGWAATGIVTWLVLPDFYRPNTPGYNAVGYSNLMLLTLAWLIYSLPWTLSRFAQAEKTLKIVTAVALFGGFILTQTRTGWLAMPVFLALGVLLFGRVRQPLKIVGAMVVGMLLIGALGATSQSLRTRVATGLDEFQQCQSSAPTADTSVCIRLQLWRTAASMFADSPWVGAGRIDTFNDALQAQAAQGKVSAYVASGFGEPHNDMLQMLAGFGLVGGLALIVVYAAPLPLFLRRFRPDYPQAARAAAAMGVALTLGFAIFGITELMFRGMRTIGMYTVLLAWLLALSAADPQTPPKHNHAPN